MEKTRWEKRKEDYGFLSRRVGEGGSVARASAAIVSIIRLTQRSWTAVSTLSPWPSEMALMKVNTTAAWAERDDEEKAQSMKKKS